MKRKPLRRLRRRALSSLGIALSGLACRGGPARIRRFGDWFGELHYRLSWPSRRKLQNDIARALDVPADKAGRILHQAYRDNDRAVFEIVTLAHRNCDPLSLTDGVTIDDTAILDNVRSGGAILLGMHMGNGILMAAALARAGYPVHVVFRDPRRLAPGLLARSLERAGCRPLPLDRSNPTRSFRQMLKVLSGGGMLYVLMDQANKGEGAERVFLGKKLRMPTGVPALAVRTGVPVIPIHAESAQPRWRFRVHPPLMAESTEGMLDAMVASMQRQIIACPELWTWHHRRWRRYHFDS